MSNALYSAKGWYRNGPKMSKVGQLGIILVPLAVAIGGCGAAPVPVLDEGPPAGQPVPQCVRDSDCDDRVFCNGAETCVSQICFAGTLPCPGLICQEVGTLCQAVPQCIGDSDCDDGIFCNGAESCVAQECHPGIFPCPGLICDEVGTVCGTEPPVEEPPSDIIRIHSGAYSGSVTCVEQGVTSFDIVTTEFNDDGDLIGSSGNPFRVGDSYSNSIGTTIETQIITSLEKGESSFVVRGEQVSTSCDNTCRFSFDAVCDETLDNLGPCALGTDCFDCGPFTLEARITVTVIAIDDRNLRFLRETRWASPLTSTLTSTEVCDGTITR